MRLVEDKERMRRLALGVAVGTTLANLSLRYDDYEDDWSVVDRAPIFFFTL